MYSIDKSYIFRYLVALSFAICHRHTYLDTYSSYHNLIEVLTAPCLFLFRDKFAILKCQVGLQHYNLKGVMDGFQLSLELLILRKCYRMQLWNWPDISFYFSLFTISMNELCVCVCLQDIKHCFLSCISIVNSLSKGLSFVVDVKIKYYRITSLYRPTPCTINAGGIDNLAV